ncbi:MAG TPA: hypothetical protein VJ782_10680, partial [Aeromicrobium sp.]|nr:hypothetical protein [Aeromicrobium sp.]
SREAKWNDVWGWGSATVTSNTVYSPSENGTVQTSVQYSTTTNYDTLIACNAALNANVTVWTSTPASDTTTVGPTTVGTAPSPQVTTTVVTEPQYKRNNFCQLRTQNNKYRRWYTDTTRSAITTTTSTKPAVLNKVFSHWVYKQVSFPQAATYKAGGAAVTPTGASGTNQTSAIWPGCIEERATVRTATVTWNSLTGMSPSNMRDLDLDSEPDPSIDATKWKPMWPELSYYRSGDATTELLSGTKTDSLKGTPCPAAAQLFEEMDEGAFDAYADSLVATGSTYLDLGLIWGGRLSSPDGIFANNVNVDPDNGAEVARHIIFMTDGDMDPTQTSLTSYGVETTDRRITSDGGDTQAKSRHLSRFRAICSAIKAKGIRIWVIAFTSSLSTDLKNCASDESSYLAGDADELEEAFQEIAKNVGELRMIN